MALSCAYTTREPKLGWLLLGQAAGAHSETAAERDKAPRATMSHPDEATAIIQTLLSLLTGLPFSPGHNRQEFLWNPSCPAVTKSIFQMLTA